MSTLFPRWQKNTIEQAMTSRRVLLLSGPRQCGKTTLARTLGLTNTEYLTLDDITLKNAAENDPHGFVKRHHQTLIIDEIQRVPSLLMAIKKAVDEDTSPGQYLLTGSANIQSLPSTQESLAGRIANIRLRPLAQGEWCKKEPTFLDKAFSEDFAHGYSPCDRDEILEIGIRGGFPEPARLNNHERNSWFIDYVNAILERDLKDITKIQRQEAMHELIHILAAWSSKFMDIAAIGANLSIRRPTLESYINALESLYLIERVRPWIKTDYDRVGKHAKLFMADCGLMASLLNWRIDQIRLDGDRSGKLIETFAFNEIVSQIDSKNGFFKLFHYRDREKREIDFLVERNDGALLGIEIKAGSVVQKEDFKHLVWFQEHLVKDVSFVGIVLYSGNRAVSFGLNLWAVPFSVLWG